MILIPIISIINIRTGKANSNEFLNDFDGVYHLEYFMQFSPYKNGYTTTKYALDLERYNESGEDYMKVSLYYEDPQLTLFNDNYSYMISLTSREILEPSKNKYNEYLSGTHTELFINTSEFESSPKIRIDEPLTFSDYLKEYQDPQSLRSDITFNYIGIEEFDSNLLYNFTTFHYNIRHVIWTDGDFWSTFFAEVDYYFDNNTGILVAENIYGYLYHYKSDSISNEIYITRTLALINQTIIMNSYKAMNIDRTPIESDDTRALDWNYSILLIIISAGILLLYNRKKILKKNRNLINEIAL